MGETFSPQQRIKKKSEFLLLYKTGRRYKGKYFSLIYLPNALSFSRFAVVASRKVGDAVERNKIKRWMRELFRRNKEIIKNPMDIIVIPKKDIMELPWASLHKEYLTAIEFINQNNQPL